MIRITRIHISQGYFLGYEVKHPGKTPTSSGEFIARVAYRNLEKEMALTEESKNVCVSLADNRGRNRKVQASGCARMDILHEDRRLTRGLCQMRGTQHSPRPLGKLCKRGNGIIKTFVGSAPLQVRDDGRGCN